MNNANAVGEAPGFFGPSERPLFGWRRACGDGPGRGWGIVFCNPLGYETVPVHRTLKHAAAAAAARGCATLRFDYDGAGDSAGDDLDPERVAAWRASLAAAIDSLRSMPGVERVALWSVRAGSLIAATAASERGDIAALVATAPVTEGARYLRELRALSAAGLTPALSDGLQEAAGFLTTEATRAGLGVLSLAALRPRHGLRTLWQPRDDLPFDASWLETWRAAGVSVAIEPFAGFEAMMRDAHRTEIPIRAITCALDWLLHEQAAIPPVSAVGAAGRPTGTTWSPSAVVVPGCVRETVLMPSESPGCFVILAEPKVARSKGATPAPLLLLLNAGSVYHIGVNRMHVRLARQLAARGACVARLDLPGIGDADKHQDCEANHPYPPHAISDLQATLRALASRCAPASLHIAGVCAGAFHALELVAGTQGVSSAAIINPLTFEWHEGMMVATPDSKVIAEAARYQQRALDPSAWLKLLRGKAAVRTLLRVMARRAVQNTSRWWRGIRELVGLGTRGHLDRMLAAATGHGTRLYFIFARGDPGLAMMEEQAPYTLRALRASGALQTRVIADADHTFSYYHSREQLLGQLRDWLLQTT